MNQTNVVFLLPVPVQLDIEWLVPRRKGVRTEQVGSRHWNLIKVPVTGTWERPQLRVFGDSTLKMPSLVRKPSPMLTRVSVKPI